MNISLTKKDKEAFKKGLTIQFNGSTTNEYKTFCKLLDEYSNLQSCLNLIGSNLELYYAKSNINNDLEKDIRDAFKTIKNKIDMI
jgi:hypothetical protein